MSCSRGSRDRLAPLSSPRDGKGRLPQLHVGMQIFILVTRGGIALIAVTTCARPPAGLCMWRAHCRDQKGRHRPDREGTLRGAGRGDEAARTRGWEPPGPWASGLGRPPRLREGSAFLHKAGPPSGSPSVGHRAPRVTRSGAASPSSFLQNRVRTPACRAGVDRAMEGLPPLTLPAPAPQSSPPRGPEWRPTKPWR